MHWLNMIVGFVNLNGLLGFARGMDALAEHDCRVCKSEWIAWFC